jgi:hypothetical protein
MRAADPLASECQISGRQDMTSEKLDRYKLHQDEYITPKKPQFVKTNSGKYLTITGNGTGTDAAVIKQSSEIL